ncbi:MAG: hypothetical protein LBJ69_03970 [Holosporales bacterium]|jgi:hypothetical protein|nr:hypothetical protein [Holosporales bacterium]
MRVVISVVLMLACSYADGSLPPIPPGGIQSKFSADQLSCDVVRTREALALAQKSVKQHIKGEMTNPDEETASAILDARQAVVRSLLNQIAEAYNHTHSPRTSQKLVAIALCKQLGAFDGPWGKRNPGRLAGAMETLLVPHIGSLETAAQQAEQNGIPQELEQAIARATRKPKPKLEPAQQEQWQWYGQANLRGLIPPPPCAGPGGFYPGSRQTPPQHPFDVLRQLLREASQTTLPTQPPKPRPKPGHQQ